MRLYQTWNLVPLSRGLRDAVVQRSVRCAPGQFVVVGDFVALAVQTERCGDSYRPLGVLNVRGGAMEFELPRTRWRKVPGADVFVAVRAIELAPSGYPATVQMEFVFVGPMGKVIPGASH